MHLRVSGDLECAQDVRAIAATFDEAAQAGSPLIVMELSGHESRLDLVWQLGRAVRESAVPVAVYLSDDAGKQVGAGQLCIGVLASACAIAPGVTVRGTAGSTTLAPLAPDNTAWSALNSELYEWTLKAATTRGVPEESAAAVVSPTVPLWALFEDGRARIVSKAPIAGADAVAIVEGDPARLVMDGKTAERLSLVSDVLPHWSAMPPKLGVKTSARTDRSITTGVAAPSARIAPLVTRIDRDEEDAKVALKLPWPVPKKIASETYHAAAAKARAKLDDLASGLAELEQILQTYPELMRRPAPGQTDIAKPSAYASRWRSLVQTRRDRMTKLADTAAKFAGAQ
jgi:hypothetical protein